MLDKVRSELRRAKLFAQAFVGSGIVNHIHPTAVARHLARTVFRPHSPSAILELHALNSPDKLAIIDGARRVSYRELDERVNRLATALAARGVGPGAKVAVMLRNSAEFLEIQWASQKLGAVVVQVGYRLKVPEVAYILEHSEPAAFFCGRSEEDTARAAQAQARHPAAERLFALGAPYEALLASGSATEKPQVSRKDDLSGGVMIYTSGTTGRPKGAARDFKKTLHESVGDFLRQLKVRHDDVHLVTSPLYHSAAPVFVAFVFALGGTVVLLEHFDAPLALELIARERITSSFMVPTMLARLADAAEAAPRRRDLSSIRWLASGAAPLPTETARRIEALFGPVLYNFYGATETGLVTLALPGEHTARPGTVGRPLSGNELRLLDDSGREVQPGQVGELFVRNSMLVSGYHRDHGATAKAMRDGFFSVGDLARIDGDGYVYLADRKTDMVISGGVNIYPLEIEDRLHLHPGVEDVAVIGVPDSEWGESLHAYVVRRPAAEVSADELRGFCKEALANYKCPKTFEFVDSLPRNPTGKVLKRELRTRYIANLT